MGTDSVARQMHQKTVQHYWVNIVKQQVPGGGCPTLKDTLIQPMEAALMMIAFITIKSSLVPLIEGLCAQIYLRFEISVVCSHLLLFFFVKEKNMLKENKNESTHVSDTGTGTVRQSD